MSKAVKQRVGGWFRATSDHLRGVVIRVESPGEAFDAIAEDTRRLFRSLRNSAGSHEHRKAVHKVKEGVQAYNESRYDDAERCFRKALLYDDAYARAHYFLANTYYKRSRLTEAVTHWQKAVDLDPFSEVATQANEKLGRIGKGDSDVVVNLQEQMRSR